MSSGCCCRNLTPSICLLLRNFHNSLSAGVVLLRRYFALTNVVGLAPTCIVRRVFFICPLTSLRLFSLSSSTTSLSVGDVLQKNREVEFIRTSLCPLLHFVCFPCLLQSHHCLSAMFLRKTGKLNSFEPLFVP